MGKFDLTQLSCHQKWLILERFKWHNRSYWLPNSISRFFLSFKETFYLDGTLTVKKWKKFHIVHFKEHVLLHLSNVVWNFYLGLPVKAPAHYRSRMYMYNVANGWPNINVFLKLKQSSHGKPFFTISAH